MAAKPSGPKVRAKEKAAKTKFQADRAKERSEVKKDAAYAAKKGAGIYFRSERIAEERGEARQKTDSYSRDLLSKEGDNLIGKKKK